MILQFRESYRQIAHFHHLIKRLTMENIIVLFLELISYAQRNENQLINTCHGRKGCFGPMQRMYYFYSCIYLFLRQMFPVWCDADEIVIHNDSIGFIERSLELNWDGSAKTKLWILLDTEERGTKTKINKSNKSNQTRKKPKQQEDTKLCTINREKNTNTHRSVAEVYQIKFKKKKMFRV